MAITKGRTDPDLELLPVTVSGRAAAGLLALSLLLLLARLVLTPAFGLPLSYLVVFLPAAAGGLVAVYAMGRDGERSAAVLVTLVVGLAAGSWMLAESIGGMPPRPLDEADNGRTIAVASGQDVVVSLPGNPTTGYSWQVAVADSSVLQEARPVAYMPSGTLIGSGGTYTFQYRAAKSGRTDVTFTYSRSWETGTAPLKTYRLTIVVS